VVRRLCIVSIDELGSVLAGTRMTLKDNASSVVAPLESSAEEVRLIDALLAQIARRLIRANVLDIDAEINQCLELICIELDLDRSTIAEIDPKTGLVNFTHGWAREPYPIIRRPLDANELLPWTVQKMLSGETVVMSSPDKLPVEAAVDRTSYLRYGPKSNVNVPIKAGGSVVGAMSFASLRRGKSWPAYTVLKFEGIAEILGYGLERKRIVTETLRLRNEVSYLSRVNTMGQLAASMAHDLNQPLGAILSNAEALQAMATSERPNLEEIQSTSADIIEDDNRARQTIQRLWSLFRRGDVPKSKIDVGELLSGIGRIVRTDALLRNISLKIDVKQPVPPVLGELVQLQQVIINLLLNAFDAVSSANDRPREVQLDARAGVGGNRIEVLVRDTGSGIAPEAVPRIFDSFFTTKPNGMGMGLAVAKSIIDAHGGTISVASNNERGATFEIKLPIANADTP
jgi:signal transduction histidine kinase